MKNSEITSEINKIINLFQPIDCGINLSKLTATLMGVVRDITTKTGVAKEHAMHDVLAAGSIAAGLHYRIESYRDAEEVMPATGYYILVKGSAQHKTTMHDMLFREYKELERHKLKEYYEGKELYKMEKKLYERNPEKYKKPREKPIGPSAYSNTFTFEGLLSILEEKDFSIVSDEAGRQFESSGMSSAQNMKKFFFGLNDLWSSKSVDNITGDLDYRKQVPHGRVVSMMLSMQPEVFNKYFKQDWMDEYGMNGRLLISCPVRSEAKGLKEYKGAHLSNYGARLARDLLNPKIREARSIVQFTKKQCDILEMLQERISVLANDEWGRYSNFALRITEHIQRIAAQLIWIEDIEGVGRVETNNGYINNDKYILMPEEIFASAIEHVRYYFSTHRQHLMADMGESGKIERLKYKLKEWIVQRQEVYISNRDIMRYSPLQKQCSKLKEQVLKELVLEEFIEQQGIIGGEQYRNKEYKEVRTRTSERTKKYITVLPPQIEESCKGLDSNNEEYFSN